VKYREDSLHSQLGSIAATDALHCSIWEIILLRAVAGYSRGTIPALLFFCGYSFVVGMDCPADHQ
jgi:hypothetical protein